MSNIINMNTSFVYIPSGIVFENRKQAMKTMGSSRYRRELKEGNFKFQTNDEDER
jgi:hypothetical protein